MRIVFFSFGLIIFLIIIFRKKIISAVLNKKINKISFLSNIIYGTANSIVNHVADNVENYNRDCSNEIVVTISKYLSLKLSEVVGDDSVIITTKNLLQNKLYGKIEPDIVEEIFNSQESFLEFLREKIANEFVLQKFEEIVQLREKILVEAMQEVMKNHSSFQDVSHTDIINGIQKYIDKN